ncbi:hypothetical protein OH687_09650 [Burkholderia anthina]|nr:hypothetical protein OH687_09650 [Burkholderia anthina]
MPIGMPGWPEFACWTASIASARIALAIKVVEAGDEVVMSSPENESRKRGHGGIRKLERQSFPARGAAPDGREADGANGRGCKARHFNRWAGISLVGASCSGTVFRQTARLL